MQEIFKVHIETHYVCMVFKIYHISRKHAHFCKFMCLLALLPWKGLRTGPALFTALPLRFCLFSHVNDSLLPDYFKISLGVSYFLGFFIFSKFFFILLYYLFTICIFLLPQKLHQIEVILSNSTTHCSIFVQGHI